MPRNLRDTLTPFRLPQPDAVWPELQDPIREYRRLVADRHLAQTKLGKLENERRRAVEADRLALARALREGAKDPGDTKVEQIDQEMANTRRTIEALEVAIEEAEADLITLVDEHQAEWLEQQERTVSHVSEEYSGAIRLLMGARDKLASAVALQRFLRTFPEHDYREGHWPVYGLIGRNDDPFRWDQVIDALSKDAEVALAPASEEQPIGAGVVERLHEKQEFVEAWRGGNV